MHLSYDFYMWECWAKKDFSGPLSIIVMDFSLLSGGTLTHFRNVIENCDECFYVFLTFYGVSRLTYITFERYPTSHTKSFFGILVFVLCGQEDC